MTSVVVKLEKLTAFLLGSLDRLMDETALLHADMQLGSHG